MKRGSVFFTTAIFLPFVLLIVGACSDGSQGTTSSSGITAGPKPIVLVGDYTAGISSSTFPLITYSGDGGSTWAVSEYSSISFLNYVSCTSGGSSAVCVAVGENGSTDYVSPALVEVSTNGGATWTSAGYFSSSATHTDPFQVSCTGAPSSATCVMTGQNGSTNQAFLAVTNDSGSTWSQTASLPPVSILNAVSCMGGGSSATCVAAGQDYGTGEPAYILVSTNSGSSWSAITTFFNTSSSIPSGSFQAVACAGAGDNPLCIASGGQNTSGILAGSIDNGSTWYKYSGVPNANFWSASCAGNAVNGRCAIAGQGTTGSSAPAIYVSTDGGSSWAVPSIPGLPSSGYFNQVSCSGGGGGSAICLAGGQDLTGAEPPILAESLDGGSTWALETIPGAPTTGAIYSVNCTGSASSATCFAAGQLGSTGAPWMAISTDGAHLWSVPTIPALPSSGVFYGIGFGY